MLDMVYSCKDKPYKFTWNGKDYSNRTIGFVANYSSSYDLTVSILAWWLDHKAGDVSPFYLNDIIVAMGDLWCKEVSNIIWPKYRA